VPQKTNGETASSVSRSGDFDEDFEDEEGGGEEELEYGEEGNITIYHLIHHKINIINSITNSKRGKRDRQRL
jgi:hypothetical protein